MAMLRAAHQDSLHQWGGASMIVLPSWGQPHTGEIVGEAPMLTDRMPRLTVRGESLPPGRALLPRTTMMPRGAQTQWLDEGTGNG